LILYPKACAQPTFFFIFIFRIFEIHFSLIKTGTFMRWWIFLSLTGFLVGICCSKHPEPADSLLQKVESAPDTLSIGGITMTLETYLWRDFMPVSPPGGQSLRAVITVVPVNSEYLPAGLQVDRIWIFKGKEHWTSQLDKTSTYSPAQPLTRLERTASGGPKWKPGTHVTVVVRLLDTEGKEYFLRTEGQPIHRTD
jgi:hypothetical protein